MKHKINEVKLMSIAFKVREAAFSSGASEKQWKSYPHAIGYPVLSISTGRYRRRIEIA